MLNHPKASLNKFKDLRKCRVFKVLSIDTTHIPLSLVILLQSRTYRLIPVSLSSHLFYHWSITFHKFQTYNLEVTDVMPCFTVCNPAQIPYPTYESGLMFTGDIVFAHISNFVMQFWHLLTLWRFQNIAQCIYRNDPHLLGIK
jgi:hypothetical protein